MPAYLPAARPTMYFIGVTTTQSSIMKVFPAWAGALGIEAVISGIDFVPDDRPERYREAVSFIKSDPLSLGTLVTTHKMNLLKASRDLFDYLDPFAVTLGEVSSIPIMLAIVALLAVFIQLYFGPLFAVPARIFGQGVAGLSSGFGNFCANLGGFASALLLGVLRDATGSFTVGFLALAGMALVGFAAVVALWRTGSARDHRLTS